MNNRNQHISRTIEGSSHQKENSTMAIQKIFQIYDNVAMTVIGIMMTANREEVIIRSFTELLSNPKTDLAKYPDDYSLLHIGEQNLDTGELTPCDPRIVYTGRVWRRLQEHQDNPDSSSPANTNGAGEQPSGFIRTDEYGREGGEGGIAHIGRK